MDQEARQQSFFLIRRLVSEGTGIVIASHDRHMIGQLADRHLNLADGRLLEVHAETRPTQVPAVSAVAHSVGKAP